MTDADQTLDRLIAEFVTTADALDMTARERAGILGVAEAELPGLVHRAAHDPRQAEFERRIAYALPLMRRLLGREQ